MDKIIRTTPDTWRRDYHTKGTDPADEVSRPHELGLLFENRQRGFASAAVARELMSHTREGSGKVLVGMHGGALHGVPTEGAISMDVVPDGEGSAEARPWI